MKKVDDASAVLLRLAPRGHVMPTDLEWGEALVRKWGSLIARQHVVAGPFPAPAETWLLDWRLVSPIRDGSAAIEAGIITQARAAAALLSTIERHESALGEADIIHGDQAPPNLRDDQEAGITTFNFANCCDCFLHDLAVARYSLEHRTTEAVRRPIQSDDQ